MKWGMWSQTLHYHICWMTLSSPQFIPMWAGYSNNIWSLILVFVKQSCPQTVNGYNLVFSIMITRPSIRVAKEIIDQVVKSEAMTTKNLVQDKEQQNVMSCHSCQLVPSVLDLWRTLLWDAAAWNVFDSRRRRLKDDIHQLKHVWQISKVVIHTIDPDVLVIALGCQNRLPRTLSLWPEVDYYSRKT